MSFELLLLFLANLCIPAWFVYVSCVKEKKIVIDHVLTFSFGFVYYWITPIYLGVTGKFQTMPGMPLWYNLFRELPETSLIHYQLVCLFCYLSFCAGTLYQKRTKSAKPKPTHQQTYTSNLLYIYFIPVLGVAIIMTYLLRDQLFRGYTTFDAEALNVNVGVGLKGTYSAVSSFLLSLALLASLRQDELRPGRTRIREIFLNRFFISYLLIAFFELSMGGRLYVASGLLIMGVYYTVYRRRISLSAFIITLTVVFSAFALYGLVRLGNVMQRSDTLVYSIFAEPLLTAFSVIYYLREHTPDIISAPIFLMGDFVNLIPSVILPNKTELYVNPQDYGYTVYTPVGALHSYFSFMINFGIIGTMIFFFCLSYFLSSQKKKGSLLNRLVYIQASGWLAFSFFRDPFSVSVVKALFQFSFLMPHLLVYSLQFLTYLTRPSLPKVRRKVPSP